MSKQKLIGVGQVGKVTTPRGTEVRYWTRFDFTNPDCVAKIDIERISLIRGDGVTIYSGPMLQLKRSGTGEVVKEKAINEPMKPHEVRSIMLRYFMKDPKTRKWLTPREATRLDSASYTLEIFWSGKERGLPLIGWIWLPRLEREVDGSTTVGVSSTQMLNMEQQLD